LFGLRVAVGRSRIGALFDMVFTCMSDLELHGYSTSLCYIQF
jgi:hypothetical protein